MMKSAWFAAFAVAFCVGCNSGDTSSDPVAGKKSADAAPKSAADLPVDMPDVAKKSAAGAIGQAQAQQQMNGDAARVKAMKMMQQQRGG